MSPVPHQCVCLRLRASAPAKGAFDDPATREMLRTQFEAGAGRRVLDYPHLTRKGLKAWVDAEFQIFKMFTRFAISLLRDYHEGNPFAQGQHDCATLDNGEKCMAMGFQFVIPTPRRIPRALPPVPNAIPDADANSTPAVIRKYIGPEQSGASGASGAAGAAGAAGPPSGGPSRTFTLCMGMIPIGDGSDVTGAATLNKQFKAGRPLAPPTRAVPARAVPARAVPARTVRSRRPLALFAPAARLNCSLTPPA